MNICTAIVPYDPKFALLSNPCRAIVKYPQFGAKVIVISRSFNIWEFFNADGEFRWERFLIYDDRDLCPMDEALKNIFIFGRHCHHCHLSSWMF